MKTNFSKRYPDIWWIAGNEFKNLRLLRDWLQSVAVCHGLN